MSRTRPISITVFANDITQCVGLSQNLDSMSNSSRFPTVLMNNITEIYGWSTFNLYRRPMVYVMTSAALWWNISASDMTCIVSSGALNSTHSLVKHKSLSSFLMLLWMVHRYLLPSSYFEKLITDDGPTYTPIVNVVSPISSVIFMMLMSG